MTTPSHLFPSFLSTLTTPSSWLQHPRQSFDTLIQPFGLVFFLYRAYKFLMSHVNPRRHRREKEAWSRVLKGVAAFAVGLSFAILGDVLGPWWNGDGESNRGGDRNGGCSSGGGGGGIIKGVPDTRIGGGGGGGGGGADRYIIRPTSLPQIQYQQPPSPPPPLTQPISPGAFQFTTFIRLFSSILLSFVTIVAIPTMGDIGKFMLIAEAAGHLIFSFRAGRRAATGYLRLTGSVGSPETDSGAWDVEGKLQAEPEGKRLGKVGDERRSDGGGDGEKRGDGDE